MGENLQLESKIIRALKDGDCYKYLGIAENDKQLVHKVWEECSRGYLRRTWFIWNSALSDENRVIASNTSALSKLLYVMGPLIFQMEMLRKLDREIRSILSQSSSRHLNITLPSLYLQCNDGGHIVKEQR